MSHNSVRIEHRYIELPKAFYSRVTPTPLRDAKLVCFNEKLAKEMGFHTDNPEQWIGIGAGTELLEGMDPVAMKYTGHQFGTYNPELGDGRGLLLWETLGPDGRHWDWHLKGAGTTPYSRFGDGRAVLRSTIREYLCSEAMAALGIPTTRGLFMVSAKNPVQRESIETAAAMVRVAQTHIRFGHFEFAAYHLGEDALKTLLDHTIQYHFPHLLELPEEHRYLHWLEEVVTRTATLIAQWQVVGFCHGVMNSDNMSIIGDTFDYGPFAFLDDFDAGHICNHTDQGGRYAYNRQPHVGFINCQFLARALAPIMAEEAIRKALASYEKAYNDYFLDSMRAKLGFVVEEAGDIDISMATFQLLHDHKVDYTLFFRGLSNFITQGDTPVRDLFSDRDAADVWLDSYKARLKKESRSDEDREIAMRAVNPKYILRNYLAQQVIQEAQNGDYAPLHELLTVLEKPFEEQPEFERYASSPPDWGKHLNISCSS